MIEELFCKFVLFLLLMFDIFISYVELNSGVDAYPSSTGTHA
jgi:hypothetical protein